MLETQFVISLKREQIRTQIRKQKNEEIFNKKRNAAFIEQTQVMNYLWERNEDQQIFNLDDIIKNRSQNIFECQLITKWLLEYQELESSYFALELYFQYQNQISLNLELKYIKLAAKIFRNQYCYSEESLQLLIKLTKNTTLRSQFLISELQIPEFLIELMNSHLNTFPLICNLLVEENFIYNFFSQNLEVLDYFRVKLFDLRNSDNVIILFQTISYSHVLCKIIGQKEIVMDLINMKPNQEILEILINIKMNTDLFDSLAEATQLDDYLIEIFDSYEFHEQILQLVLFLLETKNQNLMNKLFQRRQKLQRLIYNDNNFVSQLATNILEKYL